jgi:hypothetical protein
LIATQTLFDFNPHCCRSSHFFLHGIAVLACCIISYLSPLPSYLAMSSTTTNEENEEWTITLVYPESGHSESIPVLGSTNVAEVETLARALFGVNDDAAMQLTNDNGKVLTGGGTLQSVGVRNGHVLAFGKLVVRRQQQQRSSSSAAAPTTTRGGLDFTSLLASAGNQQPPQAAAAATTIGGLDFTSLLASAGNQQPPLAPPEPVYYTGMNLHECMQYNTHPHPFVSVCTLLS